MSERRKFTDYEKKYIYERDGGHCRFCGTPISKAKMTMHHRLPLSRGGSNTFDNLDLACWECNHMIGNMTFQEFAIKANEILAHAN